MIPQVHVLLPALRADVAALPLPPDTAALLHFSNGAYPSTAFSSPAHSQHSAAAAEQQQHSPAATAAARSSTVGGGGDQQQPQHLPPLQPKPQRRYLTCCVRLSPEKEPHRFVEIIEALAARPAKTAYAVAAQAPGSAALDSAAALPANGFIGSYGGTAAGAGSRGSSDDTPVPDRLRKLEVVPLLCGAAAGEYAESLRTRLQAAAPDAIIEDRFLTPAELAQVACSLF